MNEKKKTRRSLVMVRIPAGDFLMGTSYGHGEPDEFPQHTVWVDEFLIARNLVTAAEWAAFLNQAGNPYMSFFEPSKATTTTLVKGRYYPRQGCIDHPANGVTWHGAQAFCQWLTQKTGKKFRLPTEAEWEKASRGHHEGQRYPWGNSSPVGLAHFNHTWMDPRLTLCPVGSYPANDFGLYDMVGLVWEWCSDWYDRNYYQYTPEKNPAGPEEGTTKVLRGGSWGGLDVQVRCGIRVGEFPDISEERVGFRVARSAD